MYAEGLKTLIEFKCLMTVVRYTINAEKLKANISANKLFCGNLAMKIGSKMIEQMGENSRYTRQRLALAAMTLGCCREG